MELFQTLQTLGETYIFCQPIVSFMNSFNGETEFGEVRTLQNYKVNLCAIDYNINQLYPEDKSLD